MTQMKLNPLAVATPSTSSSTSPAAARHTQSFDQVLGGQSRTREQGSSAESPPVRRSVERSEARQPQRTTRNDVVSRDDSGVATQQKPEATDASRNIDSDPANEGTAGDRTADEQDVVATGEAIDEPMAPTPAQETSPEPIQQAIAAVIGRNAATSTGGSDQSVKITTNDAEVGSEGETVENSQASSTNTIVAKAGEDSDAGGATTSQQGNTDGGKASVNVGLTGSTTDESKVQLPQSGVALVVGAEPAGGTSPAAQISPSNNTSPEPALQQSAEEANAARVARALQQAVKQGGGTVTMRLMPPELGVVRVQMELSNGVASVRFQTEDASVASMLTRQMTTLKQALESRGLRVDRLEAQALPPVSQNGAGDAASDRRAESSPDQGRSRGGFTPGDEGRRHGDARSRDRARTFERALVDEIG